MTLINCRDCKRPISRSASHCPYCGKPRPGTIPPWIIVVGLLAWFWLYWTFGR